MWTKAGCSYCQAAIQLLEANKINYQRQEIDTWPEKDRVKRALLEYTKHSTFPNVFIGTEHIGGYTELQKLFDKGQLSKMLKEGSVQQTL